MIGKMFGKQFQGVASAALLMGGFSVLAKLLGLYRNRIFTSEFGAGSELDIYYAGFLIPDFIYNLFILGLLSAVFIPIFSEYFHKDEKEAWHFTNVSLNIVFLIIGIFSALMYFLMPYILPLIVHGFSGDMKTEAVTVARLMLLSPIFFSLSSVLGGVVQNFKKYVFYSLAPVLYNVGIIFGALFFGSTMGAYGLAIGVVVGAFLYLFIQTAGAISSGFKYRAVLDFQHIGFLKMSRLSIARFFSIAVSQLNFIILTSIASFLAVGSIAIFNLANDLQFIPIGIVALSYAVAVFPKFSDAIAKGDKKEFSEELFSSLKQVLFFVLPISALLATASFEIVIFLYGIDTFGVGTSRLVSAALVLFSFSIFAQSLSPILTRAFFAMQNTLIPLFANAVSIIITIALSFIFVFQTDKEGVFFDVVRGALGLEDFVANMTVILALPIAFSIGAILNFIILLLMLRKFSPDLDFSKTNKEVLKMIVATLAMAVVIYFILRVDFLKDGIYLDAVIGVVASVLAGGGTYIVALWLLKSGELSLFWGAMLSVLKKISREKIKAELPANIERADGVDRM